MGQAQPDHGDAAARPPLRDVMYRCQLPAWVLSLSIHLTGLLVIAAIVPHVPQGAAEEPSRHGGIVLVSRSEGPPQYFSESQPGGNPRDTLAADTLHPADTMASAATAAASRLPEIATELAGLLPEGTESIAGSEGVSAGSDRATQMAQGGRPGSFGPEHGYAQTGVFGVVGKGTKFVYVFDRSGSMAGFAGRPLAAAKRELLDSLNDLSSVHQFQIIFYNERPTIFNPTPSRNAQMMFGTDVDKQSASAFVRGIVADGGTQHLDALKMALRMKPDVIFFLTDADEPTLSRAELDEVRKLNDRIGCSINAIEFGVGPRRSSDSFLVQIARQNSGNHAYVDLTKLSAE